MTFADDFLEDGLERAMVNEYLEQELERAGYDGMELEETPMGVRIVLRAEKPGMVIGKGGRNIREMTDELQTRFSFDDLSIDVQEVEEPDLSASIVSDKLANSLERGWYFRRAGQTTIEEIMDKGAQGAEIIFTGKLTGARSRVEKFNRGYIKHNGQPAQDIIDKGEGTAVMPLGTIGVKVKIMPPNASLPDSFNVEDNVDLDEVMTDGINDLLSTPDESPDEEEEIEEEDAGLEDLNEELIDLDDDSDESSDDDDDDGYPEEEIIE